MIYTTKKCYNYIVLLLRGNKVIESPQESNVNPMPFMPTRSLRQQNEHHPEERKSIAFTRFDALSFTACVCFRPRGQDVRSDIPAPFVSQKPYWMLSEDYDEPLRTLLFIFPRYSPLLIIRSEKCLRTKTREAILFVSQAWGFTGKGGRRKRKRKREGISPLACGWQCLGKVSLRSLTLELPIICHSWIPGPTRMTVMIYLARQT